MNNKFIRYVAGTAFLTISSVALAQSSDCVSVLNGYESYLATGNSAGAQQIVSKHPQCFGGSVSSQSSINATVIAQSSAISNALSNRLLSSGGPTTVAANGVSGMAAGAQTDKWNIWGSMTGNSTKVDYVNAGNTFTKNSSDILTTVIGADYALSSTMVVGLSGAFDNGTGAGQTGVNAPDGINTSGYLLAPYLGLQLTKDIALDASVGFGNGQMSIGGSTKSDAGRLFGAANLSYSHWFQSIQLTGKLGYLHAEEDYADSRTNGAVNANTKNRNRLDQFRVGAQVGYWMNGFMPYAALSFATDSRSSSNQAMTTDVIGKNAMLWTLGVNLFSLNSKVTGGLAYNVETARNNSKNDNVMANINVRF